MQNAASKSFASRRRDNGSDHRVRTIDLPFQNHMQAGYFVHRIVITQPGNSRPSSINSNEGKEHNSSRFQSPMTYSANNKQLSIYTPRSFFDKPDRRRFFLFSNFAKRRAFSHGSLGNQIPSHRRILASCLAPGH